jgi:two-component system chemotaxis sensor kinase CheA
MGGMDSIIAEFLAESVENLDQLDQDLVSLEKNPSDREIFSRIFRTIHTIKGTCGFLAFQKLEDVTHIGESLLSRLRDGTLDLSPELTTDLLAMIDAVRVMLAKIDKTGAEGEEDYSDLIEQLQRHDKVTEEPPDGGPSKPRKKPAKAAGKKKPAPKPEVQTPKDSPAAKANSAKTNKKAPVKKADQTTDSAEAAAGPDETENGAETLDLTSVPTIADSNIRVDVRVLDHLMNLVGELVLARNQIVQNLSGSVDRRLAISAQRLDTITGELQEAVMQTRMQPISSIWKKLPRFTRDLSLKFDKQVEIQMEGEDTDLDKSIIEAIKGSILHLVRNAVDHGIEKPDDRAAQGKPRTGTLRLRAQHEGGNVIIEIRDDGGGLDLDRVLAKAVKVGLVDEADAAGLGRREVESFVFRPGFSTASRVTNISGRGVGLDVVRANIESMGGSIDLQSEPGKSTTFRLKIPLTLAIVSVLLVTADTHQIAIPQASVIELIRIDKKSTGPGIEDLNGVAVFRLRGKLLPLIFLNRELGIDDDWEIGAGANIVVLQGDDRHFGLVVEAVEDSQEIVVKPLGRMLSSVPFAGATILGDGQIALILDVFRLGLTAGVISESRAHTVAAQISAAVKDRAVRDRLVCVEGADNERMAVEIDVVNRLEHLPRTAIERVGGQMVVQYGEEILQLIDVQQALPERRKQVRSQPTQVDGATIPVIVCSVEGRRVGLMVHRIADIVEEELKARRPGSRDGVRACAVISERITEILDLEAIVRMADPEFFDRPMDQE